MRALDGEVGPLGGITEAYGWKEKRRHPRRPLAVRCWIGDGRHTLYARVHDVSLGGLSIRAPVPFSPDAELELTLIVGGEIGASQKAAIRARGRVVWVRQARLAGHPTGPRMGAEFLRFVEGEDLLRLLVAAP